MKKNQLTQSQVSENRTRVFNELLDMLNNCHPDEYADEDFAIDGIAKRLLTMSTRSVGTNPYSWVE